MERVGQVRLTSNRPFFSKTVSDKMAVEAAYTSALVSKMSGVAVNERDTFEKTVIFTPQRGGKLSVNGAPYAGDIIVHAKNGNLMVVNEVDVEQYLRGVIPSEMPHEWPMEALKTQAVISRTYALYQKKENQNKEHDLPASVLGQVYKGESASHHRTDQAIMETNDIVATYDGALALTFFHSTSAGHTEDAQERWGIDLPYLKGVSCPFDRDSPYYQWERSIPLSDLEEALAKNGVKTISTLTPFQYSRAGRILDVRILHQGGETFFKAEGLRRLLGYRTLPSTNFRISSFGKTLKISGMGWGHGVGLCQYGTKVLAERGFTFDEIVSYYYPGVVLEVR
jgi:stage II sporulation protein D